MSGYQRIEDIQDIPPELSPLGGIVINPLSATGAFNDNSLFHFTLANIFASVLPSQWTKY
jgi:hypothetical protein